MTTAMMRWRETLRHVCLSCPRGCCTQNRSHKSSVRLKRWLSVHKAHTVRVMCECEGLMCDLTSRWHCLLQISRSSSWHARYTVLTYLQVMVFYNLFTFLSDAQAVGDVRALVLHLLQDEQLEVWEYICTLIYAHYRFSLFLRSWCNSGSLFLVGYSQ